MAKTKGNSQSVQTNSPTRPPIVVVMGHVDHGKTTLLDSIRKTNVAAGEHGGITQSIGAYQVEVDGGKKITFIDTPGHEAFTNMRSRGARVADIAILVVAANDSVMPQTVESIRIIKKANIPFIVAINKIDLPEANFDKVVQDLLRHEVMLENYGGDVPYVKISAKNGQGIKELLDLVGLLAEVKEIGKIVTTELMAVVIESKLDKGRGALGTVVVKSGSLKVGEEIYINEKKSKIRALIDYTGAQIKEAPAGTPVEIIGLSEVPSVGSVVSNTVHPAAEEQEQETGEKSALNRSDQEGSQSLSLILKADALGTLEAITAQIPANVNLISSGVGEISEADVMLAKSTGGIILGFNVKVNAAALKLTETEKVLTRTYRIIYELLDELKDAAAGMLVPEEVEEVLGQGQVIAEFPFEKLRVCGTRVMDGRMARGDLVKITRAGVEEDGGVIGRAKIKSLRVGKDEANKAEKGKECGILLEPQVDFRIGDDIIAYRLS